MFFFSFFQVQHSAANYSPYLSFFSSFLSKVSSFTVLRVPSLRFISSLSFYSEGVDKSLTPMQIAPAPFLVKINIEETLSDIGFFFFFFFW
jgi:hypothetical protein